MKPFTTLRISIVLAAFALAYATATTANAQSAPVPAMMVGDRWVYNVKSGVGLSSLTYQEIREVTALDGGGGRIEVTGKTADGKDFTRVEEFAAPGVLRSGALCIDETFRFPVPLQRFEFPIAPGQRSTRWVDVVSDPGGRKGQINYYFHARGWETQIVPAGSFDAIRVDVLMALDDSTPFRNATTCSFTYWYSPVVRGTVRERRTAQYTELDEGFATIQLLDASYELAGFTPGRP
jgi:hypothetical protein